MNMENILTLFAIAAGVVAVIELLEYIFTKNIPWLFWLVTRLWRWGRRQLGRNVVAAGQRYLVLNFSAHPLLPQQRQAIQARLCWPKLEIIDTGLGNVNEGNDFVTQVLGYIDKINLTPEQWQTACLAVVAAGYAPAWAVLLAELHGRLGYFPDMVRLRPAGTNAEEKFEVAEIVSLREIRNRARAKR
ncbi:MAG: hypothetical protein HS126_40660 [Anaerolineales bacterium]|nr:hypothetical protein [Anaerolineales bacterium]